jgi:hypothetical protein
MDAGCWHESGRLMLSLVISTLFAVTGLASLAVLADCALKFCAAWRALHNERNPE